MLHGLEECRTLGVDDAFQSELREGPLWKTAYERPHLADSSHPPQTNSARPTDHTANLNPIPFKIAAKLPGPGSPLGTASDTATSDANAPAPTHRHSG